MKLIIMSIVLIVLKIYENYDHRKDHDCHEEHNKSSIEKDINIIEELIEEI